MLFTSRRVVVDDENAAFDIFSNALCNFCGALRTGFVKDDDKFVSAITR